MAGVVIPIILCLTVIRTFLVVDALVIKTRGVQGAVARVIHIVRSDVSQSRAWSSGGSPRLLRGPAGAGPPKARFLHRRLLCMHFAAVIGQSAGTAKYLLPVTDRSCLISHRAMLSMAVVFDASLVLFLLAKAHVTNGSRKLACWEQGLVCVTRLYGWVYMPIVAIFLGATFPGAANDDEEFCYNGITDEHATTVDQNMRAFWATSAVLIIEFVLLLVLFLKPMLIRRDGTQSGGALYRRVMVRNVVCTSCVVLAGGPPIVGRVYTATTVIVSLAVLRESAEISESGQTSDIMIAANQLGTLCLMEIALPLGFGSCWKECAMHLGEKQAAGISKPNDGKVIPGDTATKVIPVEMTSPETP